MSLDVYSSKELGCPVSVLQLLKNNGWQLLEEVSLKNGSTLASHFNQPRYGIYLQRTQVSHQQKRRDDFIFGDVPKADNAREQWLPKGMKLYLTDHRPQISFWYNPLYIICTACFNCFTLFWSHFAWIGEMAPNRRILAQNAALKKWTRDAYKVLSQLVPPNSGKPDSLGVWLHQDD